MTQDEKVRENRLRRAAERQGLMCQKSRTRDPLALTYGGWRLIDIETAVVIFGDFRDTNLDDVEAFLKGDDSR